MFYKDDNLISTFWMEKEKYSQICLTNVGGQGSYAKQCSLEEQNQ